MIIKRKWNKRRDTFTYYSYVGYFLFGFIPFFISREIMSKI